MSVGDLQTLRETCQGAKSAHRDMFGLFDLTEPQQRLAKLRCQWGWKRSVFRCLYSYCVNSGAFDVYTEIWNIIPTR
jgi:hypothetical protein